MRTPDDDELFETLVQLIRVGWARPDSRFRRVLTAGLIPTASEEQMCWVDDLQRTSTSAETAIRAAAARRKVDVTQRVGEEGRPRRLEARHRSSLRSTRARLANR